MSFTTDVARWRALSIRDPTANGHFFYTVKSTNIYCRPTCPARLARRANIGFCKTAAEAEAAGYRACKRCKPNQESSDDPQEKAVAKACRLIEEGAKRGDVKAFRLQELAKNVGLTPRYFHKVFKDKMGLTPKEYAKAKMQGAGGGGADPFLHEALNDLAPLNLESFNFDDLIDFDFEPGLSVDGNSPSTTEPCPADVAGSELEVNTQVASMGSLEPVFTATGPGNFDTLLQCMHDPLFDMTWAAATSAFEADAALLLGADTLLESTEGNQKDLTLVML